MQLKPYLLACSYLGATLAACTFLLVVTHALHGADGVDARALALLRGVEMSRTHVTAATASLEIDFVAPAPKKTVQALVEVEGDKVRFEILSGGVPGQVIIRDGHEFTEYRRVPQGDVDIYDSREAVGTRGTVAFDPRVLGLSARMPATLTVQDCLWYDNADELRVIGQEEVNGIVVWRVRAVRSETVSEYWIEEPGFRVHRRTEGMHTWIDSSFEGVPDNSPFPSKVIARRHNSTEFQRIYRVQSMDVNASIPPTRFTLASMDVPLNTPIVDYRISRIVGYWGPNGVSRHPVEVLATPALGPSDETSSRYGFPLRIYFIVGNLIVFVVLIGYFICQRRTAGRRR